MSLETTQNKKLKTDNFMMLDPLCLSAERPYNEILKYLSGNDLLNLTEVSRQWNQLIGQSPVAMNKIQLVINENWSREFDIEDVISSERQYKHIKITSLLRRRDHVYQFFDQFASSLVSIDSLYDFDMNGLQLPHLEWLAIRGPYKHIFLDDSLLDAVVNLKTLIIEGSTRFPEKIISCLKLNPGLKELVLEYGATEDVFKCMTHPVDIHLKTLKLDKVSIRYIEANIGKFLGTQVNSLEELKLMNCDVLFFCKIFNTMKNLRCLTYSPDDSSYVPRPYFEPNESLVELRLIVVSAPLLQLLLPAVPKVEKIYLSDPTLSMLRFALFSHPSLMKISFAAIRGAANSSSEQLMEHYEKLKNSSNDSKLNFKSIVQI